MYSDIQLICFSYTEVVLNLAECESRLGNSAQAENYLNQVITANIGSPAYSSNVSLSSSAFTTRTSDEFIKRLANVWQSELRGTGTYFAFLKRNNIAVSTLNIPVLETGVSCSHARDSCESKYVAKRRILEV